MSPSKATVESLTIEVKAIRIDGRKMTIAVFQQLPSIRLLVDPQGEKPTIREDLNTWGYVRHKVRDEGELWLVSERNGELCRAPLFIMESDDFSPKSEGVLAAFRKEIFANHEQLFIAT